MGHGLGGSPGRGAVNAYSIALLSVKSCMKIQSPTETTHAIPSFHPSPRGSDAASAGDHTKGRDQRPFFFQQLPRTVRWGGYFRRTCAAPPLQAAPVLDLQGYCQESPCLRHLYAYNSMLREVFGRPCTARPPRGTVIPLESTWRARSAVCHHPEQLLDGAHRPVRRPRMGKEGK